MGGKENEDGHIFPKELMSQLQTKGNTALCATVLLTRVFLNVFLNSFAREAQ